MTRFIMILATLLSWSGLVQAEEWDAEVAVSEDRHPDYDEYYSDLVVTHDGEEVWRSSEHNKMPDHHLQVLSYPMQDYDGDDIPDFVWRGWKTKEGTPADHGFGYRSTIFAFYSPGKDKVYWIEFEFTQRFSNPNHPCHIFTYTNCRKSGKIPKDVWKILLNAHAWNVHPHVPSKNEECMKVRPACKKFRR